jgi:large subunit ribosomal protein L13|uniref:Ribosomal protein L13 n=1 Tax=Eustigmatophyceae sp. Mont 10/10-1w TaxID=2506145 RepID=A0A3R5WWX7_9STRA|nr:ribosomal protein L13 [Eustigmatophyceae sp. Mont 10/10-1w]QAA11685.1 ribosomal protein L13 [Eustigmatophyceae sp. Mont 10/10-1w]
MINTFIPLSKNKSITWFLVDAADQTLGRLSTQVANLLQGKTQVTYTPGSDSKTYVIIINASKIKVTGKKATQKFYYSHTGKPGELRTRSFSELSDKNPEKLLELSIKRMLPNGFAKSNLSKRLKVYKDIQHPHTSQQPKLITLNT